MYIAQISVTFFVVAVVLLMIALTLNVIRRGQCRNYQAGNGRILIHCVDWACWITQILCIMSLVGGIAPLHLVPAMLIVVIFVRLQISVMTRHHQGTVLGNLLVKARDFSGSLPDLLECFARANPSMRGIKAIIAADRMRRGSDILTALKIAKLRIPLASRFRLSLDPSVTKMEHSVLEAFADSFAASKLVAILAYLPALLVSMLCVYAFLLFSIIPTFREMFEEFELRSYGVILLERIGTIGSMILPVFCVTLGLYAVLAFIVQLAGSDREMRMFPLVGNLVVNWRRASLLDVLSIATRQNQDIRQAIADVSASSIGYFERRRLNECISDFDRGRPLNVVLNRLLTKKQSIWMEAAQNNAHISEALRHLAHLVRLRLNRQVAFLLSIGVPIVILLLAVPVGLISYAFMSTLTELTIGLS